MKTISLSQNKMAIIDDEDYERVSQCKWTARRTRNGIWYAHNTRKGLLHRFLINAPANVMVDHKNGNTFDCRKDNLRLATNAQNQHNSKLSARNVSGFRGVSRSGNRWKAQIQNNKVFIHLGYFATPEDAAKAYDAKVRETRGQFGRTNF